MGFHCKHLFSASAFQARSCWEYNTFICQLQKSTGITVYFSVFAKWKQVLQNTCSKVPAGTQIPEQTYQRRISRERDLAVKAGIRNASKRYVTKPHLGFSITVRIAFVPKMQLKLSLKERFPQFQLPILHPCHLFLLK